MVTLEAILNRNNLNRACKQVVKNKGSAGEDDMKFEDLLPIKRQPNNKPWKPTNSLMRIGRISIR